MLQPAAQIAGRRDRIVVQEIYDVPVRRPQSRIALYRRLVPSREQNFNPLRRILQSLRRRHGADIRLNPVAPQ